MKALLFAVLLALTATPVAAAIGERACADAAIRGQIIRQTYERVNANDSNVVIMDVLLHVTVKVKTILFGPIHRGTVLITGMSHTELREDRRTNTFYLFRQQNGSWSFADSFLSNHRRRGP